MSNKTYRKLNVIKASPNLSEAIELVECVLIPPKDDELLIKNIYAGVNATDLLATSGALYEAKGFPFTFGFEALGIIKAVGKHLVNFKPGQYVATYTIEDPQGYCEYQYMRPNHNIKGLIAIIPELKEQYVGVTSGLTPSIGLDIAGQIKTGEKVLVTSAAGGTGIAVCSFAGMAKLDGSRGDLGGHLCVQLAKMKGCYVIGMTSSPEKAKMLKELGTDRVINYKTENLDEVLTKEFPDGIDVIWETIGGQVFQILFKHLSLKGRLVLIGSISGYKSIDNSNNVNLFDISMKLMVFCNSLIGFSVPNYAHKYSEYTPKLIELIRKNQLRTVLDFGKGAQNGEFFGIGSVVRAIEYLHSGKNTGKVMVKLQDY